MTNATDALADLAQALRDRALADAELVGALAAGMPYATPPWEARLTDAQVRIARAARQLLAEGRGGEGAALSVTYPDIVAEVARLRDAGEL